MLLPRELADPKVVGGLTAYCTKVGVKLFPPAGAVPLSYFVAVARKPYCLSARLLWC